MNIRLGQTVSVPCSVADNGIKYSKHQDCVVTASSVMDTLSVKYFFKIECVKVGSQTRFKISCSLSPKFHIST